MDLLDQWLPIERIVAEVNRLGLADPLVPKMERSTLEAQKRGLGKVLSAHADERFVGQTEDERVRFRLEKARRRFEDGKSQTRYGFIVIERMELEANDDLDEPAEFQVSQDLPKLS